MRAIDPHHPLQAAGSVKFTRLDVRPYLPLHLVLAATLACSGHVNAGEAAYQATSLPANSAPTVNSDCGEDQKEPTPCLVEDTEIVAPMLGVEATTATKSPLSWTDWTTSAAPDTHSSPDMGISP